MMQGKSPSIPNGYLAIGRNYASTGDVPRDRDLFYRCGACGGINPSAPKDNVGCSCGGVSIDKDMWSLAVRDLETFEVLRTSS